MIDCGLTYGVVAKMADLSFPQGAVGNDPKLVEKEQKYVALLCFHPYFLPLTILNFLALVFSRNGWFEVDIMSQLIYLFLCVQIIFQFGSFQKFSHLNEDCFPTSTNKRSKNGVLMESEKNHRSTLFLHVFRCNFHYCVCHFIALLFFILLLLKQSPVPFGVS